mgnify:FL=1
MAAWSPDRHRGRIERPGRASTRPPGLAALRGRPGRDQARSQSAARRRTRPQEGYCGPGRRSERLGKRLRVRRLRARVGAGGLGRGPHRGRPQARGVSAGHGVAPPSCRDWVSRSYCAAGLGLAPIVRRLCTSTARRSAPGGSGACRRSPEVRDCPPASGGEGAEVAACVRPMLLDCAEPPQTVPANASR